MYFDFDPSIRLEDRAKVEEHNLHKYLYSEGMENLDREGGRQEGYFEFHPSNQRISIE
jgi:hypothetical protein